jgi:assimilatory nitrate reductase catalytic subunit
MTTLLQDEQPTQSYGRALLAPGATPPVPVMSRGKTVCNCFNVTDSAIESTLANCTGFAADRLETLQATLQCGTHCGSCLPQLQRMVRTSMAADPASA